MAVKTFILASLLCMTCLPIHADTLLIDVIDKEPINSSSGLLRPKNAQTMADVKSQFGDPGKTYPAIGEPPITRWSYPLFSVYFEHNLVIHSVVNKPKKAP